MITAESMKKHALQVISLASGFAFSASAGVVTSLHRAIFSALTLLDTSNKSSSSLDVLALWNHDFSADCAIASPKTDRMFRGDPIEQSQREVPYPANDSSVSTMHVQHTTACIYPGNKLTAVTPLVGSRETSGVRGTEDRGRSPGDDQLQRDEWEAR